MSQWSRDEIAGLCSVVESMCPEYGCHVALTGGLLYKLGPRKDADILFYRIRQRASIDVAGLLEALAKIGIRRTDKNPGVDRWCIKAEYQGRKIDLFFPEAAGSDTYRDEEKQ